MVLSGVSSRGTPRLTVHACPPRLSGIYAMLRRSVSLRLPLSGRQAVALLIGLVFGSVTAPVSAATPEEMQFFEAHVRPILVERCHRCHGDEKQSGGLRLDSYDEILRGGDSGPALRPGSVTDSLLIEAINYESFEMPPSSPLPADEVEVLTRWIEIGAPWPDVDGDVEVRPGSSRITDEDRAFWSLQPVRDVEPPRVDDGGWGRNEIDAFVFRQLQQAGLEPAPEATRRTLIRRLYFDLIGLPPEPAEVDAFVNDDSPAAYEDLVDRLLRSPQYGERMARGWLDLVRYAESDGYKQDGFRPNAWRYRDYVVRALNEDNPYDQFVREQLAGDELAPSDPETRAATGFLRHWIYEYNQRDVRTQWSIILNDITDVTAEVFLGVGLGCARCHDHKFDPLLREDYFRFQAFFTPLLPRDDLPYASPEQIAAYDRSLSDWESQTEDLRRQIDEIEAPYLLRAANIAIDKFPPDIRPMIRRPAADRGPFEQQLAELAGRQLAIEYERVDFDKQLKGEKKARWQELKGQLAELAKQKPKPLPMVMTVTDVAPEAPPTLIPSKRPREVEPGFLTVLDPGSAAIEPPAATSMSTGRRTALANWITSQENPLATRVIVNRLWQHHFGKGIVATTSDLGRLGERPSHPELLDWLARRFVADGWSMKSMHRLMVTSATYRQASAPRMDARSESLRIDPENRLLWKMPVRRLQAEQLRDAMLAVSGELKLKTGGPSVAASEPRRSIYIKVLRNSRDPLMAAFDAPDGFSSSAERNVTTTPTQALLLINGDWGLARARQFAQRLRSEASGAPERLIERAFQLAYGRSPTHTQLAAIEVYFANHADAGATAGATAGAASAGDPLVDFCHVVLNSNEFVYVD